MQQKSIQILQQYKPAIFDWLVLSFTITMGLVFPSLGALNNAGYLYNFMLFGLLLYVIGALIKRKPMYYRLAVSGQLPRRIGYILLLVIGHFFIMLTTLFFALHAFGALFDWHIPEKRMTHPGIISGAILVSSIITWLIYRGKKKTRQLLTSKYIFGAELIGDILLIIGVSMLSFIFWEKSIFEMMARTPINNFGDAVFRFFFLSIAYMLFYLPLRYLYLIEERNSNATGKRFLLIFLILLIRGLLVGYS